jgi:flagellar hook-length control protein FliK
MTKVDGPRGTPPTGGDAKPGANEPRKGEFDQVLGQQGQQGQAPHGTATALPTAVRSRGAGDGQSGSGSGSADGQRGTLVDQSLLGNAGSGLAASTLPLGQGAVPLRARAAGSIDLGGAVGANFAPTTTAQPAVTVNPPTAQSADQPGDHLPTKHLDDDDPIAALAGHGPEAGQPLVAVALPSPETTTTPAVDAGAMRLLADKLGAAMDLHLAVDRPQLSIGLDLGALGQGQVSIERNADGVTVAFQLATPESASFLAERLPHLEQALNDRGIAVANLDAGVAPREVAKGAGAEGAGGHGSQGEGQRERRGDGQGDGRSRGRFDQIVEEQE